MARRCRKHNEKLEERIELKRRELEQHVADGKSISDDVIYLSQELDRLLVGYMKKQKKGPH